MTALLRRLFPSRPETGHLAFTVYTRATCGCCDKALAVLHSFQDSYAFTIETVDVDSDPVLAAEHGGSVPVVALNGKVRFRGVVNPVLLKRLLKAER
jgi:glutaredoxin